MLRCSGCSASYQVNDIRVPPDGIRVRCPSCGHVFRLRRAQLGVAQAEPSPHPATSAPAPPRAETPAAPSAPSVAAGPDALPGLERPGLGGAFSRPPVAPAAPKPTADWREASEPAAPRFRWDDAGTPREQTLALGGTEPASRRLETPPFRPGGSAAPSRGAAAPSPARSAPAAAAPAPTATPTPAPASAPPPEPAAEDAGVHERARRLARVLVSDILVYNQPARDRALREGNLIAVLGTEVDKAWALYKAKVDRGLADCTTYFKDALNEILANGQKVF